MAKDMQLSAANSQDVFQLAPGYQIIEQIYVGSRTIVYRAVAKDSQQPVIIKLLRQDAPNFADLLHFRNQYTIVKNLEIAGIVRPLSLETWGDRYALVMADFGGISLRQWLDQQRLNWNVVDTQESTSCLTATVSTRLGSVLAIALQMTEILAQLHQAQIIHKDIKPANILIQPESQQVQLIDFSIASTLPKETAEIQNPAGLAGTLAYLAPEQTGRMNRGIDYRADFYALGVTLFELLTGEVPFQSHDPLELVHCHLAKQPPALTQRCPDLPETVAKIVHKLMAKNAEDRYQTSGGLRYDLQQCLEQWERTGQIDPFPIATRDSCDRLLISEKLYGRDAEVQTLLSAFERIAAGTAELMLIAGFSGIGKTAVVNEVHKPIVRQRGYFIRGKFDQFNRNIPFSAFVQALHNLIGQLLTESDAQLAEWRAKISQALGNEGQLMIDVVPALEKILGPQPPVAPLLGNEAEKRFHRRLRQFIQVFATAEHPLVFFLDDLQWADLASFSLMELLVNSENQGYLLLLGAYRDNEVSSTHPLMIMVDKLVRADTVVETITLSPLSQAQTNQLVADTLNCSAEAAFPLTQLVHQKAKGNPFFTTQLLKALHQEQLLTFDWSAQQWQCNLAQVRSLMLSDDVVAFMTQQLQKLPAACQNLLQLAACIGSQFDLTTLATVAEYAPQTVATNLWPALQAGFIYPQNEDYKFFQTDSPLDGGELTPPLSQPLHYSFLHDRIQQAAYVLIAEAQRPATHRQIGQLLWHQTPASELAERLFEIVNHLNIARSLLTTAEEGADLARLNLRAGRQAKSATAYKAAMEYLVTGIELLPEAAWQQHYDLTLQLYTEATDTACLITDFEQMEHWANQVLQQARSLLDTIPVQRIRLLAAKARGHLLDSLQIGWQVLHSLGVPFPEKPTPTDIEQAFDATYALWAERSPLELLDLPTMDDPHSLAAMEIMTVMVPSAYRALPPLMPLLICKQVELSIQFGNCATSTYAYADYGLMLCGPLGDYEAGYRFGQLAQALVDRLQANAHKSRTGLIVHTFISHWREPLSASLAPLLEAYQQGLATGELESVALGAFTYCYYSYLAGQELGQLASEMEAFQQTIQPLKQVTFLHYLEIAQQTVWNLMGADVHPERLTGKVYAAQQTLVWHEINGDRTGLFHFHFNQMVLYYLFGQYEGAAQHASQVAQCLDGGVAQFPLALYPFYEALIQLARYAQATPTQQTQIRDRVQTSQAQLEQWATLAPVNHQHRWYLVEAERCAVLGDRSKAIEHYDRAIAAAQAHQFIQDEALANERAAQFYLSWGKPKIAAGYLQDAYNGYARWGARAKTEALERDYPDLLRPILTTAPQSFNPLETLTLFTPEGAVSPTARSSRSSSSTINASLDFASVLKASQALSSTIHLDELLHQLTQIILQNSGGDFCALILPDSVGTWRVEALATPDQTEICAIALDDAAAVPTRLIHYVKHTQAQVLIDDLETELPVVDDTLQQLQPKSLLCLPLIGQGHLIGVVYLHNQGTRGVFTSDRIQVLNFLCTQAAISLENARLYQQSQDNSRQLEHSLQSLQTAQAALIAEEAIMQQQASALLQLSQSPAISQGQLQAAFQEITEVTAQLLQIERVSVWLFDAAQAKIECIDLFERSTQRHSQGVELKVADYPKYFAAVMAEPILSVQDAWTDPRTSEFQQGYLDILNIASMLDSSFRLNGYIGGVICCEQIHEPRPWQQSEQNFVRSVANLISLTLETHQRQQKAEQLEHTLADLNCSLEKLRISENRFQKLADNMPGMIYQIRLRADGSSSVPFVSSGCQDLYEIPAADFMSGKCSLRDFEHPDDRADISQAMMASVQNLSPFRHEWRITPPSGQVKWLAAAAQPDRDGAGDIVWDGLLIDVSDRKQVEVELQQKTQELQQTLKELSQTQLQVIQNEKMSSLGQMVAGIAHEINNPVNFIYGNLSHINEYTQDLFALLELYRENYPHPTAEIQDLLEEVDLPFLTEDLEKVMQSMRVGTDRIRNIVLSLRNFSRLDEAEVKDVDLHEGIDSTITILRNRLKARSDRPEIQVDRNYGKLPRVQCYAGQLNQVFMNIMSNAIDALEERDRPLTFAETEARLSTITIQSIVTPENCIRIVIADNGPGIPDAVQKRLFDPFFTTKPVGKGTGLGLSISYQIVTEKHHGKLWCESTPGIGTKFFIDIPLDQKHQLC